MSARQVVSSASSVPSASAPIFIVTTAAWRLSVCHSSARGSTSLTGRPAFRASAAAIASVRRNVFAPKEPPIGGTTTRTRSDASPKMRASSSRRLKGVCVPVNTSSRSPSQRATHACGSMAACCAAAVRYVSSTTTSASAQAAATSPWRSWKRWHTFVPGWGRIPKYAAPPEARAISSWTSGAPWAAASTTSRTAGTSS